jgi:ABC-type transport system substrate-binding protein
MLTWLFTRPHQTVPRIQELVEQGRAEVDLEKRRKLYQELYRIAHDEALWLFVHAQDELWAKRRTVPWVPYAVTGSKAKVYYFQVPGR